MSYLPLAEDNRLDIENLAEDLAHAAFGHGNSEEFLRGYFAQQLAALVDRRQRAALDEREGNPMYVGELQPDGTYSVRREDVRLMTRALLAVERRVCVGCTLGVDEYAWPCCGDGRFVDGKWHHAEGCTLDEALDAAGLDTQAKRDAAREAMRGGG